MRPNEVLRRRRIDALLDVTKGAGLEIGPLDAPVVGKAEGTVRYVDLYDAAGLRDLYREDPVLDLGAIVEVDVALHDGTRVRSLAEAAADGAPYDWVIASHVAEHVPDLVAWLADVAALLADDAPLVLVVPDRRYSFDAPRPGTTVGQLLQAHTLAETAPSERAVFDHYRSVVHAPADALWAGSRPSAFARKFSFDEAAEMRRRVLDEGAYVDCHVWVVTPAELVDQVLELGRLGLCDFTVDRVVPTAPDELEFVLVLRRLPRGLGEEELAALRSRGVQELAGTPVPPGPPLPGAPATAAAVPAISDLEVRMVMAKRAVMGAVRRVSSRLARGQSGVVRPR